MKSVKGLVWKTITVMLLVAAVFVMVGYILATQATAAVTNSMSETVAFNAKSAAATVNEIMSDNLLKVTEQDFAGDKNKNYTAQGALDDMSLELNFFSTETAPAATVTLKLKSSFAQEFKNHVFVNFNLATLISNSAASGAEDLSDEIKNQDCFFYIEKDAAADRRCDVLVQTHAQFGGQLRAFVQGGSSFDLFGIVKGDTVVYTGTPDVLPVGHGMGIGFSEATDRTLEAFSYDTAIGGVDYLLGSYRLYNVSDGTKYYFVGYTDMTDIRAYVDKFRLNIIVVIAFCFLLIAAAVVVYGLMLRPSRKSRSVLTGLSAEAKEVYPLSAGTDGTITQSGSDYDRRFSTRNLSECVVYKTFNSTLSVGDDFLCAMKDHKGDRHLLDVTVTRAPGGKKSKKGYDLLASDLSDLAESMAGAMNIELASDDADVMKETYDKLVVAHKRILAGRLYITNLTNLQVMFGKHFSDLVFSVVVQKASTRFESVFPRRIDDSIGVIVSQAADFTARCDDLNLDMNEMNKPVNVDDNLVSVGCEGGFDLVERGVGDTSFAYVDRCIRAAMKRAAADEHKEYYVYHDFQKKQYLRYMDNDYDIKKMLDEDSFEMQFQPQFSIAENRVAGFEALFRFKKTLQMDIDTFSFIQYAERTGNMILLGNFIFENSMRFAKSIEGRGVTVSLNVSPVQLMQVGFTENLLRIYRQLELKPGSVCIEITESFLMTSMDETLKKLDILKKEGINVHLDDFGTRFSSMLYLKKLPISAIKIDMEFVRDLCNDDYSRSITQMIISIAKQLGVESIAEGVETEEQKKLLAAMGCDYLQGFLIGKSMPEKEALKLL